MTAVHASAQNGSHRCLALLLDNTEDNSVVDKLDRLVAVVFVVGFPAGTR